MIIIYILIYTLYYSKLWKFSYFTDASECTPCPAGFYCPAGTQSEPRTSPIPCQPGSYNPIEHTGHPLNCIACEPGFACPEINQTSCTQPCKDGKANYQTKKIITFTFTPATLPPPFFSIQKQFSVLIILWNLSEKEPLVDQLLGLE